MRIANIMLSRQGGGIEQASIDYAEALRLQGHHVICITSPGAWANGELAQLGIETHHITNLGQWDIFAARRLRKLLLSLNVDIVISHANRALSLSRIAIKGRIPLVGVAHNYNIKRYGDADGVFTITRDLVEKLSSKNVVRERIFHIPNMVRCSELPHRNGRGDIPVIGGMGRFVAKKGFDVYIDALKILKERGVAFKAVLGGTGAEAEVLQARAKAAGLAECMDFSDWVQDKKNFYTGIDIFCLPSLHEPFGIVLLEAFTYGTPVIATDSEGPRDIINAGEDALIVEMGSAAQLASAIETLINDAKKAEKLAANAFAKVKSKYALEVVGADIEKALRTTIANWRQ